MSSTWTFTLKRGDIVTNVAILLFSAFIMREGFKLGAGWGDAGPGPGFFPVGLTLLMMIGATGALVQALRSTDTRLFFQDRQELLNLLWVGVPAALAIAFVPVFGLYATTALYIGLFGYWYGRFTWYWSLVAAIAVPAALYVMLRLGFNILMPRSLWSDTFLPF